MLIPTGRVWFQQLVSLLHKLLEDDDNSFLILNISIDIFILNILSDNCLCCQIELAADKQDCVSLKGASLGDQDFSGHLRLFLYIYCVKY